MKIKTAELSGHALDWAVAVCTGRGCEFEDPRDPWLTRDGIADQPLHSYTPSTDWAQGWPIIEREGISVLRVNPVQRNWHTHFEVPDEWAAELGACSAAVSTNHEQHDPMFQFDVGSLIYGPTPLIAAMRCYVASRMGEWVDVPDELVAHNHRDAGEPHTEVQQAHQRPRGSL